MRKSKALKALTLCTLAAAICGGGQTAYAHTGIKDKVFVEGLGNTGPGSAAAYNAFTITHGCLSNAVAEGTAGAVRKNVIAQAAVFPNSATSGDARIFRYVAGTINGTTLVGTPAAPIDKDGAALASPNSLTGDIQGASATGAFDNFGLGLVSPNLFGNIVIPKLNDAKALRGYAIYNGPTKYDGQVAPLEEDLVSTTGLSAFKHTIPKFKSTSCAKSLVVRVAVANWCLKGKKSDNNPDRMDVWVGSYTNSQIFNMTANPEIMPNSAAAIAASPGKDFWPSFTVNRDTVNNPFQGACADPANQYDVVIEPTGTDIDKYLNIPKGKYPAAANGPAFWPQP